MTRKLTAEQKSSVKRHEKMLHGDRRIGWDCFGYDDFGAPADPGLANDRANTLAPNLLGKTLQEAEKEIRNQELISRLVEKDGQFFIVTRDVKPHRLNLTVKDNKITKVSVG